MDRPIECGLEVEPSTDAQVATQPEGDKYYIGIRGPNDPSFDQPNQPNQPQSKSRGRSKVVLVLIGTTLVCLGVAVGAGAGVGLAAYRKSNSSSAALTTVTKAGDTPVNITLSGSLPVTIAQSGDITTTTPTLIAQSGDDIRTTPASVVPAGTPIPSPLCPAANGSTYIGTNSFYVSKTSAAAMAPTSLTTRTAQSAIHIHIPNNFLPFEILCYTNFVGAENSIRTLQVLTDVQSLGSCVDQCALYNFNAALVSFPALGCTGVAYGTGTHLPKTCWLKSNVTLGSPNGTDEKPGFDGAVLLGV